MKDVIPLTGKDDNLESVRLLLHQSILHANVIGAPKGDIDLVYYRYNINFCLFFIKLIALFYKFSKCLA